MEQYVLGNMADDEEIQFYGRPVRKITPGHAKQHLSISLIPISP